MGLQKPARRNTKSCLNGRRTRYCSGTPIRSSTPSPGSRSSSAANNGFNSRYNRVVKKQENCPYHGVQPSIETRVYREKQLKRYVDLEGRTREYSLERLQDYICFCPLCRAANAKQSSPMWKFGYGYYSRKSKAEAQRNWNSACVNATIKIFKNEVKGKNV